MAMKKSVNMDGMYDGKMTETDYLLQYLSNAANDMCMFNNNLEELQDQGKETTDAYGLTKEMLMNALGRTQRLLLKVTEVLTETREDESAFFAGELTEVKKPDVEHELPVEEEAEE